MLFKFSSGGKQSNAAAAGTQRAFAYLGEVCAESRAQEKLTEKFQEEFKLYKNQEQLTGF